MNQWCCDTIIIGENPEDVLFPINNQLELICRYKAHITFGEKSKAISNIAKPEKKSRRIQNGLIGIQHLSTFYK